MDQLPPHSAPDPQAGGHEPPSAELSDEHRRRAIRAALSGVVRDLSDAGRVTAPENGPDQ